MKNTPKEIYLNFEERWEDFKDHSQITWSEERINDSDIRFVLSDNSVIHGVSDCNHKDEYGNDLLKYVAEIGLNYCSKCNSCC